MRSCLPRTLPTFLMLFWTNTTVLSKIVKEIRKSDRFKNAAKSIFKKDNPEMNLDSALEEWQKNINEHTTEMSSFFPKEEARQEVLHSEKSPDSSNTKRELENMERKIKQMEKNINNEDDNYSFKLREKDAMIDTLAKKFKLQEKQLLLYREEQFM